MIDVLCPNCQTGMRSRHDGFHVDETEGNACGCEVWHCGRCGTLIVYDVDGEAETFVPELMQGRLE